MNKQRFLPEGSAYLFACETRGLAIFPRSEHVSRAQSQSVVAIRFGLGHEGCGFTIGVGDVVHHVFVFCSRQELACQRAKESGRSFVAGRNATRGGACRPSCPDVSSSDSISRAGPVLSSTGFTGK